MQSIDAAWEQESPLQIAGVINAYAALQAQAAGFKCLYLSGAGVANAQYGLPDLGMTSASDVAEEIRRIASVTDLPLLVDADTGWGGALNVSHTVSLFARAGASAMHLEDQNTQYKRCGHRPEKRLVSCEEMCEKLLSANEARQGFDNFSIMARTDAVAVESLDAAIKRSKKYIESGADCIFAEALTSIEDMKRFVCEVDAPVLINMTEFGKTPLLSIDELAGVGVKMVLYPLSAFRAMSKAAELVYQTIRKTGSQSACLPDMQTRNELYETLDYLNFESKQNKE